MTDVGLDRAEHARLLPVVLRGVECPSQGVDFDGVAERCTRAVRLDVTDGRRVDVGDGMRLGDDVGLRGGVGGGESDLRRSVVVDRRPADDGVDAVPVVQCRLQRLEDHDRDAAAEYRAVRTHVERPAVSGRRDDRPRLVPVADIVRDADRHPTGERHVALTVEQALTGEVHRDQGGGTRRLDGDARASQVELVGNPRRQEVLVVLEGQPDQVDVGALAHDGVEIAVGEQVVAEIAAGGTGSVHPDRTVELARVAARVLQRMPGTLQEEPVLRIGHAGRLRGEPEEVRVELLDAVENRGAPDVGRIGQDLFADAGCAQRLGGQRRDRLFAGSQVGPELRHRVGAGKPAGHADDRDRVGGRGGAVHTHCPRFRRWTASESLFSMSVATSRRWSLK